MVVLRRSGRTTTHSEISCSSKREEEHPTIGHSSPQSSVFNEHPLAGTIDSQNVQKDLLELAQPDRIRRAGAALSSAWSPRRREELVEVSIGEESDYKQAHTYSTGIIRKPEKVSANNAERGEAEVFERPTFGSGIEERIKEKRDMR
nr:hypothetical protein CFP56_75432 [Quercus suber]